MYQAGLPPKWMAIFISISVKVKEAADIHIRILPGRDSLSRMSSIPVRGIHENAKRVGRRKPSGNCCEILDQQIRDIISPGRITVKDWITIIKYAHSIGIPTTSTIMYGHVETSKDKAKHLGLLRTIQKQTRGFRICSSELRSH